MSLPPRRRHFSRFPTDTGFAAPLHARGGVESFFKARGPHPRRMPAPPAFTAWRARSSVRRPPLSEARPRRLPSLCSTVRHRPVRAPLRPSSSSTHRRSSARPYRRPPACRPCATADAMYSKCGVSPRIRQPRQTMAPTRCFPPRDGRQSAARTHPEHAPPSPRRLARQPSRTRPARRAAADR